VGGCMMLVMMVSRRSFKGAANVPLSKVTILHPIVSIIGQVQLLKVS
jgi:hypothetical protein